MSTQKHRRGEARGAERGREREREDRCPLNICHQTSFFLTFKDDHLK